jgi:hypothetical protein
MAKNLGNISNEFNFEGIVESLNTPNNGFKDVISILDENGSLKQTSDARAQETMSKLFAAGYKDPVWNNLTFFPNTHFSEGIVHFLDKKLGTVCTQCWINRVPPGAVVPPHTDWDGREEELEKLGELFRYSLHIGQPDPGHMFWLEGDCLYMEDEGQLYQWNDSGALHGGGNSGYTNKYLLIYRGLKPHTKFDFEYVWQEDNDSVLLKLKDGTII